MRALRRFRPSPAMVVASVALLVALGGTSIAAVNALPRNSVGTAQLKGNAVVSSKVRNRSLLAVDFARGQIPRGPQGPQGPEGPQGPQGAQGSAGPAGAPGPSDAYARFVNGPVAVPAGLTTLANLSIPQAGNYVVFAKVYFTATASGIVACALLAGADNDVSQTWASGTPFFFTLSNQVVHNFAAAGDVQLRCQTTGTTAANSIKITAIKVGTLTNS